LICVFFDLQFAIEFKSQIAHRNRKLPLKPSSSPSPDYRSPERRHTLDVSLRLKKQLKNNRKNDPLFGRQAKRLAWLLLKSPACARPKSAFSVAMKTQLGGYVLLLRE